MRSARSVAHAALRRGSRTVLLTYPGLGLGNYLYFVLRAHMLQRQGRDYRVVQTGGIESWLGSISTLGDYLVRPEEVRVRDRREHITPSFFQAFNDDFTRDQLEDFVSEVLLPAPLFNDWRARAEELREERVLTVNVRRGDYYEVEEFRQIYGFDVESYVRAAVDQAQLEQGRFGRVHVVSDGVAWCRANLRWLHDYADVVSFVGADETPQQHLRDVALSPALVLANSTFSFWGAYISNVVHQHNHGSVWAPRFFGRGLYTSDGSAWQLDPGWRVVEELQEPSPGVAR